MAAVAAANESELQAAAAALEPAPTTAAAAADARRPLATLDPRLLMAARHGDSKALKDLLQFKDDDGNDDEQGQGSRPDDEGSGTPTTAAAAAASTTTSMAAAPSISPPHIIVEVDPRRPHDDAVAAPLPPPPVPVLHEDEATIEGESLLVHSETVEQVVEPAPLHDDDAAALPARQPPPPAAAPAGHSAVPVVLDDGGVTISEGDSLLHVVAACGDTQEFLDCVDVIVRNKEKKSGAGGKRRALEARNNKGDTPLHCAAGAGNANMISCLVALVTGDDEAGAAAVKKQAFLRMQNECGETALHQAIRTAAANHKLKVACIDHLMDVDPELACIPPKDGASPLYMAISLGEIEIACQLYVKSKGKLSYSGPDGRNVLHAAVYRGQAVCNMILEWLKDTKPKEDSSSRVSLVSQLTSQKDKKHKGSTPLHLAASLWGWRTARLLLDANESIAYQADDEGSYPIHVAAWSHGLGVVMALLELCPDYATLRDGKGRTFLHVAAEKERLDVVRYVCEQMPQRLSSMILNAQDSNGDTVLHGAVRAGNLAVFNCLLRNRQVRLDVANKDGMTPLDLSVTMIPVGFNYTLNPRNIVCSSLLAAGAPHHLSRMILNEQHSNRNTGAVLAVFKCLQLGNRPHGSEPEPRKCGSGSFSWTQCGSGSFSWTPVGLGRSCIRYFGCYSDVQESTVHTHAEPEPLGAQPNAAKDGMMTPLDLSWTMIPAGFNYGLNPRSIVRSSLFAAGAPYGRDRPELFTEKHLTERDDEESKKHTEATQVMSIVTALIATVTFASAFTLPGGYRADGEPVLAGSYAFNAFILADTLAFICSISSTCTLVYAGLPAMDIAIRNWYFNVSAFLLQSAARSLVAAFGLGLYLLLAPVHDTNAGAVAACVIVFASSLYGNMAAWQIIRMATTVLARIGIRRYALVSYARRIFLLVLVHFWSYVIIFGFPAISKWVIPAIRKWVHQK